MAKAATAGLKTPSKRSAHAGRFMNIIDIQARDGG
jgi:hypothetical protein